MDYKDFIKKGGRAVLHYFVRERVYYLNEGSHDYVPHTKHVRIISSPRDEYGRFTNDFYYDDCITVKVIDERGDIEEVTIDNLEPDVDPASLSFEQLKQLYREMCKGSLYYSDYRNTLGVFENVAMDMYDSFYSSLCEDYYNNEAEIEKHDNEKEFAEYASELDCYLPEIAA